MKNLLIFFLLLISHFSLLTSVHAEPPQRMVSLAPNLTEILFAMGLGERIVGVTNFCDYPEEARKKPKIGGMSNPSLEEVISLKPDIVLLTTDGNPKEFHERLHSLGVKTYVFKARRLSELSQGIRDMGVALGAKEEAETLAKELETTINKYKAEKQETLIKNSSLVTRHPSLKRKVLFIIWPEPLIVAGPGTVIDDAITLFGNVNVASRAKSPYPKYSVEETIHQAPDVIFIGKGHMNIKEASRGLLERLSKVPAVKNEEVCFISDSIYRLSPRVIVGMEEMAKCLR